MSGDKKATTHSFMRVRGKKVSAEVVRAGGARRAAVAHDARAMVDYWRMSVLGGVMSGTIGVQGHYANGLAALFIACGQDAACVAEAAVGVTRSSCATTAGCTRRDAAEHDRRHGRRRHRPAEPAGCLDILGLAGAGTHALRGGCRGAALAGELSIIGALAAGHFTRAHQQLARGPSPPPQPA